MIMKQKLENILRSPYLFILFMAIKLLVYYRLIGVNVSTNILAMGTLVIFTVLLLNFSVSDVKSKKIWFLSIYIFISFFMYADCTYYSYYHHTVSLNQIWQVTNIGKVPNSIRVANIPLSNIIFIEIPIIYIYFIKNIERWVKYPLKKKKQKKNIRRAGYVTIVVMLLVIINPIHSDQIKKINSVEFVTHHIIDVSNIFINKWSIRDMSAQEVLSDVKESVNEVEGTKYYNIGNGKNLIVIQMESFQNFVIGANYNGQEITPNLNELLGKDTVYFDHYYSNIGKGNTADAEFSSFNSLYPVMECECYSLYRKNTYMGLPWLMREKGYKTLAVHGNEETFFGRNKAYPYQGFEEFFSQEDMDNSDLIGMGVSDKSVFKQTVDKLSRDNVPFFCFINTLSNHKPFNLRKDLRELTLKEGEKNTILIRYLQTIRYADAAIGQLMDELKEAGLYDNTIIALYGDHQGLNCTTDDIQKMMTDFIGREYDFDEMMNVPLIIHIPGSGISETISTVGGQIDFLPTISNIMGIEIEQPYTLGQDIVNAQEGFVAFTNFLYEGSFVKNGVMFEVSREGIFEGSRVWEIGTGKQLDINDYKKDYERAVRIKKDSRVILDQDLVADYVKREKWVN